MNVAATLDGEIVNIVSVNGNGTDIYISYIDSSDNLKYKRKTISMKTEYIILATDATII